MKIKITIMWLLALCTGILRADGSKPNIVFIIVDDLGPFDLSCTGSDILQTPNIDRIAHEGIRFTRAQRNRS